jgi:oligopeptide/dipeptide ABC transporter ATP-binding protein
MYLGNLVEVGPTDLIFDAPAHPYTLALLSAISEPEPRQRKAGHRLLLAGEIPSPKNPPPGCRFHTRCPFAEERCRQEVPVLQSTEPGRVVACHFWQRVRESQASGGAGPRRCSIGPCAPRVERCVIRVVIRNWGSPVCPQPTSCPYQLRITDYITSLQPMSFPSYIGSPIAPDAPCLWIDWTF